MVPMRSLRSLTLPAAVAALFVCAPGPARAQATLPPTGPGAGNPFSLPPSLSRAARRAQAQPGAEVPTVVGDANGFSIAQLKYGGGGDWYADETSISNLLAELKKRTAVHVAHDERIVVSAGDEQLFNHPFLFITGHGNIKFTPVEVERLRAYLLGGGFLWADDDYGMDAAFRRELRRIMPDDSLVELPFDHEIYHSFYKLEGGCPKIMEHDDKPAQGLGVFHDGRLVCFYTYQTDIGDGCEEAEMHGLPPEKREAAFKMAVNIVMYSLTH